MDEVWKEIPGGLYAVSSLGRIKRIACRLVRNKHRIGKLLTLSVTDYGYLRVKLCHDGKEKDHSVHSLVASVFIGPRPLGKNINHKDSNKKNNMPENLEYTTPLENSRHAVAKRRMAHGQSHAMAKFSDADVRMIKGLPYHRGLYRELSKRFSVDDSTILAIHRGKSWKHIAIEAKYCPKCHQQISDEAAEKVCRGAR